jgi:hypothetical protein
MWLEFPFVASITMLGFLVSVDQVVILQNCGFDSDSSAVGS